MVYQNYVERHTYTNLVIVTIVYGDILFSCILYRNIIIKSS